MAPGSAPSRLAALLADDAPVARALLARRLREMGVPFVEAVSVAEGGAVDPTTLACALLDLELGDGSGVDVANALRERRPELPIAFFSGGAAPEEMARARAIGRVFRKPEELDAAIAWIVQRVG